MHEIEIIKEVKASLPLTKREVSLVADATVKVLKVKRLKNIGFSVVLISNSKIQKLNAGYRGKDKVTDILSFPLDTKIKPSLPLTEMGDIFLAPQYVRRKAVEAGDSLKTHYAKLLIHGLLHLAGHDHKKDSDYIKMSRLENKIFDQIKNKLRV